MARPLAAIDKAPNSAPGSASSLANGAQQRQNAAAPLSTPIFESECG
jgi:hypothetical protein